MNYIMRLSSRSCDLCFGEVFKKRNDAIDTSINNQTSKSQWKTNELFIESFNKKWNGKNIQWLIYKLQKNTEIYLHKEVKEILACIYHCFVEVDRMNYYLVISLYLYFVERKWPLGRKFSILLWKILHQKARRRRSR